MAKANEKMLRVKLVHGLSACKKPQIAIAYSLGLRRIGDETTQPDNGATQGKIHKISHLVEVTNA